MKIKETKSSKLKVKMTQYEAEVLVSILSFVRLGSSSNHSDVVCDFLDKMTPWTSGNVDVNFTYDKYEGHMINV